MIETEIYDASEQDILIEVFTHMLRSATKDGGRKRAAGIKPPWWRDPDHEKAIFSHLNKKMHGELRDSDSGAHPYIHLAWRALAEAYQDTYGKRDPIEVAEFAKTTVRAQPAFPGFERVLVYSNESHYDLPPSDALVSTEEVDIPIKLKVDEDGVVQEPTVRETNAAIEAHFDKPAVEPGTRVDWIEDETWSRRNDSLYRSGYGRPQSILAEHIRKAHEAGMELLRQIQEEERKKQARDNAEWWDAAGGRLGG